MAVAAPLDLATTAASSAEDRAGGTAWRTITRLLWQYLRSDMRDVEDERRRRFPVTYGKHMLKPVPLVRRLAMEQAQLYLNPPQRTFDGLDEAATERMLGAYRNGAANDVLLSAHQQLCALNNSTVWVWPDGRGGVRFLVPPPHDQAVELGDPTSHDEADVSRWFVRLPVGSDVGSGITSFGTAMITPTRAEWTSDAPGDLAGKGIWADDGSNPLGFIPAVRLRNALPAPGEFWAHANETLLMCQRAVQEDATSLGVVALHQTAGQAVLSGVPHATAAEIELGPETVVGLSDPDHRFEFVQADPRLDAYRGVIDHYLKMSVALQGMSPATVLKSSALTALAKRLDNLDRDVERRRHINEMTRAESRLAEAVRGWINHQAGVEVVPPTDVAVSYREPVQIVDELHQAQALERLVAMGITTPAEDLSRREAMSLADAEARVAANLAQKAAMAADTGAEGAALNGAQVVAALAVAERVGNGQLTVDGGVVFMVEALGVTEATARRVLGGAQPAPLEVVA